MVDGDSGALAGVSVGLELVTQNMQLPVELTHVVHTTLEERFRVHHTNTLSAQQNRTDINHFSTRRASELLMVLNLNTCLVLVLLRS